MKISEIIDKIENNMYASKNSSSYEKEIGNIAKSEFFRGKVSAYRDFLILLKQIKGDKQEAGN